MPHVLRPPSCRVCSLQPPGLTRAIGFFARVAEALLIMSVCIAATVASRSEGCRTSRMNDGIGLCALGLYCACCSAWDSRMRAITHVRVLSAAAEPLTEVARRERARVRACRSRRPPPGSRQQDARRPNRAGCLTARTEGPRLDQSRVGARESRSGRPRSGGE